MPGGLNEAVLDERLTALEAARSWSPRVVSRLEARIRGGADLDVFRINPISYAAAQAISDAEAIDLFLHATRVGLFDMEWNVVCASCGNTSASFRSLEKVDPHFTCDMCQMQNNAALDDFIQVSFTVARAVRRIAFHDPDTLSPEDLYFRYHFSRDVRPTIAGLTMPQMLVSATRLLIHLRSGETTRCSSGLRPSICRHRQISSSRLACIADMRSP